MDHTLGWPSGSCRRRPSRGRAGAAGGAGPVGGTTVALASTVAALVVAACSFDYPARGAEELADQVPETVLTDVAYIVVRDGQVRASITADQVENYPRAGTAVLAGAHYAEFDDAGEVVATGSAERAVYYTASEDAELSGAVDLRSESQTTALRARVLRWESEPRRLSAPAAELVELVRDDGSAFSGAGFTADLRRKAVRFAAPVTGTVVIDNDADE